MDPNEIKKELDEILELAAHKPIEANTQALLDAAVYSEQTTKTYSKDSDIANMEQLVDSSQSALTVSALTQQYVDIVESQLSFIALKSDQSLHDISKTNIQLNDSPVMKYENVVEGHPVDLLKDPFQQDKTLDDVSKIDLNEIEQQIDLEDNENVDSQHQTEQPSARAVSDVMRLSSEVTPAGSSAQENELDETDLFRHDHGTPLVDEDYQMIEFEPTDESTENSYGEHLQSELKIDEDLEAQDGNTRVEDPPIEEETVEIIKFQHKWQDPIAFAMLPEDSIKCTSSAAKQFVFGSPEVTSDGNSLPKSIQNEVSKEKSVECVDERLDLKNEETVIEDLNVNKDHQDGNDFAGYSRENIEVKTLCCVDAKPLDPNAGFLGEKEDLLAEKMKHKTESKAEIKIFAPMEEEYNANQEEQVDIVEDARAEKLENDDHITWTDFGEVRDSSDCPCGCLCEACWIIDTSHEEEANYYKLMDELEIISNQPDNFVRHDSEGISEIDKVYDKKEDDESTSETAEEEAVVRSKESFETLPAPSIDPQISETLKAVTSGIEKEDHKSFQPREQKSRELFEQPLSIGSQETVLEENLKTETMNTVMSDKRVSWQKDLEQEGADLFFNSNTNEIAQEGKTHPMKMEETDKLTSEQDFETKLESDEHSYQIVGSAQAVEEVKILSISNIEHLKNENIENVKKICSAPEDELENQRQTSESFMKDPSPSQPVENHKQDELEKVFLAELNRIASRPSGPESAEEKIEREQSFSFVEDVQDAADNKLDDGMKQDNLNTLKKDVQTDENGKKTGTDSFLMKAIFDEIKKQMKSPDSSREDLGTSQIEHRDEGMKLSATSQSSDETNTKSDIESAFDEDSSRLGKESHEDSESSTHIEQSIASETEKTALKFNPEVATLNGETLEQERRSSRISWLTVIRQQEAAWIAQEEAEEKTQEARTSEETVSAPSQQFSTAETPEISTNLDNSGKASEGPRGEDLLEGSSSEILRKFMQVTGADILVRDSSTTSKTVEEEASATPAFKEEQGLSSSASIEQSHEAFETVSTTELVKIDCPFSTDPNADHQEHTTFEEVSHKIYDSHEAHEPRSSEEIQLPADPKETVSKFDPKTEVMTAVIPDQGKRNSLLSSMMATKQEEVVLKEMSFDEEPTVEEPRMLRRAEGTEDLPSLVSPDKSHTAEMSTRICGCTLKKMIQESLNEDKSEPKVTGTIKKTKVQFPNESISIIAVSVMNVDIEDLPTNSRTISEKIKNRRPTTAVPNRSLNDDDDDEDGFGDQSLPNVPSSQLSQASSRVWIADNVSFGTNVEPSFHRTTPLGKQAKNQVTRVKSFESIDLTKPSESSDLATTSASIEKRDSKLRKCKCFLKRVSKVFRKKKE